MKQSGRNFVVATPNRTCADPFARALERADRLRFLALGTRRGISGVPPERTRLKPAVGLVAYAAARMLSNFAAESFRFRLHPWFDRWVCAQLLPGDHILSSYGYTNACFDFVRRHRGHTFLDAGNSHPEQFWSILTEELRRWNSPYTPVARHHYERSLAMLPLVDYVLAPSSFVAKSFLDRGFSPDRVLRNIYPVDLSCFVPLPEPRPTSRPLTVISTGRLSLRKGSPYLLEAFQLVLRKHPTAQLLLTRDIETSIRPILGLYRDLPIHWAPSLPHPRLAERLRSADVFVLPSLEDGYAVTLAEALACGLPVVTTPNTGASDLVEPGVNGEIVPIRDAKAMADAILNCRDRIQHGDIPQPSNLRERLSFETFENTFLAQLAALNL